MRQTQHSLQIQPGRRDKRAHLALPLRISYHDEGLRTGVDMACTYDIYSRGARIVGARGAQQLGQIVTVERGRCKALCRVVWIGDPAGDLRGQCAVECVDEEKVPWAAELAEAEEVYDTLGAVVLRHREITRASTNRRRVPRFATSGGGDLYQLPSAAPVRARLKDISEYGCMIIAPATLSIGAEVQFNVDVADCRLTLQGRIKHEMQKMGSGIEFHGIRRGDRPLLQYMLRRYAEEVQVRAPRHDAIDILPELEAAEQFPVLEG